MTEPTQTRKIKCPHCGWEQSVKIQALEDASLALVVRGNVIQSLVGKLKNLRQDPLAEANNWFDLDCPQCQRSFRYHVKTGEVTP